MPCEILHLVPRTDYIHRCYDHERWFTVYMIPGWAVDALNDCSCQYGAAFSLKEERWLWMSGSRLFSVADTAGCRSPKALTPEHIMAAISGTDDRDSRLQLWLKRITLWLAIKGDLKLNIALSAMSYAEEQTAFLKTQASQYGERIVAMDLMDMSIGAVSVFMPPAWCSEEYNRFCKGLPEHPYYIAKKRQSVLMMRWIDRRHHLSICADLRPSMLAAYRDFHAAFHYKYHRNENFISFLVDSGALPDFMKDASARRGCNKVTVTPELGSVSDSPILCSAVELYALQDGVVEVMKRLDYSDTLVTVAKTALTSLASHLHEQGRGFSLSYAMAWCASLPCKSVRHSFPTVIFIASRLLAGQEITADMLIKEHYSSRCKKPDPVSVMFAPLVEEFLSWEAAMGWSESTMGCKRRAIKKFTEYLQTQGCTDFSDLTAELINGFVLWDHHKTLAGKSCYNLKVRGFLGYLADKGVIPYKVAMSMPGCCGRSVRPVKILTPEQREEIRRFCSEATSEKNSRIKLALLLALRMGMRKVDIVNLKLTDINLETDELMFVQQKTKRKLKMPIPDEVLEGLCQYLLRTPRSENDNEQVMLSVKAPHGRLKVLKIRDSFKDCDCGSFSLHDCRRTLATDMLAAGVDMWTIVEALGHSGLDTVHLYLSAETDMLRECCLPMDGIAMPEEVWS